MSLGGDPYSDYSEYGTVGIVQYPLGMRPAKQQQQRMQGKCAGGQEAGERVQSNEELALGIWSDATEAFGSGMFDVTDPACDPYF